MTTASDVGSPATVGIGCSHDGLGLSWLLDADHECVEGLESVRRPVLVYRSTIVAVVATASTCATTACNTVFSTVVYISVLFIGRSALSGRKNVELAESVSVCSQSWVWYG